MFAKFRLRNLFARYPFLDGLRLSVLAGICNYGIRFFDHSYKITKVIAPGARLYLEGEAPALFALYHGRMIGMLRLVWPRDKVTILVSGSRDGEIIARALAALGYSLARGSPAHKAVAGTVQLIKAARAGQHLAVMVDGPRGPIYSVKPGVIKLAQLTNLPIVPFVCCSRSQWWFWGWDRFMATSWGSPMLHLIGEPILVSSDAGEEELEMIRSGLSEVMERMRNEAEQYMQMAR